MKGKSSSHLFSTLAIAVLVISLFMGFVPVHAANPLVQTGFTNYLSGTTTGSAAFSSNVASGNVLVAVFAGAVTGNTCPTLAAPTDTRTNTFTLVTGPNCFTSGGATMFVSIYLTTTSTSGADTISQTSTINAFSQFGIFELNGVSTTGTTIGTGTGTGTNTCATSSTSFTAIAIAIAGCGQNVHNSAWGSADLTLLDTSDLAYAGIGSSITLSSPTFFHMGESFGSNTFSDAGVIFVSSTPTGSQSLGSCPTKNTATFTMVNSTQYFYTQTLAANNEVIGTITAEVASVNSGHSATETLYFAIYSTAAAGAISASNPFLLAGFKTWTLSATSAPQNLVWSVGSAFNSPLGATVGIALIGNSKILINQSSLAGMFTGASGPVVGTTGTPAGTYTSLTGVGTELFFCGTLSFQTVFTTTVTTTVGTVSTTLTNFTSTVTTTTTATTIDQNVASTTSTGATLMMLIILIPAITLGGIGALAKSPAIAGGGFVGGLAIGAGIGNRTGLVPFWLLGVIVIACVLIILLLIMVMIRGSGGGGG